MKTPGRCQHLEHDVFVWKKEKSIKIRIFWCQNITQKKNITPKKTNILWLPQRPPKNTTNPRTTDQIRKKKKKTTQPQRLFVVFVTFFWAPVPRPNLDWDQPSSYPASSQPSVRSGVVVITGGFCFPTRAPLLPPGGCFNQQKYAFWINVPQEGGMMLLKNIWNHHLESCRITWNKCKTRVEYKITLIT